MLKTTAGSQTGLAGFEKKLTGRVPDDSVVPDSVRRGVRLMLAGAAITAVSGVFSLIVVLAEKNVLTSANGKKLTSGDLISGVVGTIISYAVLVTIWVLMARFNRAGSKWARLLASVFAVIATWYTYQLVNSLKGGDSIQWEGIVFLAVTIVIWVIGVLCVAMIWRPESSLYFNSRTNARPGR